MSLVKKFNLAVLLVCFACLALGSIACNDAHQETSATLYESAVVTLAEYSPAHDDTNIGFTTMNHWGQPGLDVEFETVPEKYSVILTGEHITFDLSDKETYEKMKSHVGKKVKVAYTETYEVTSSKKSLIGRSVVDVKIID